jgi:ethanolamine kinase
MPANMTQPLTNGELNGARDHVRFIGLSYDGHNPEESSMRLVLAVQPDWASESSNVELIRCTDGITNTLLKAVNKRQGLSKEQVDDDAILLRAYGHGTDVLIDRQRETENHELLMKNGLAPVLLARFNNGMLYRYIRGAVTSPEDLRKPPIYRAVARRLAQWHATVPCLSSIPATNGSASKILNGESDVIAPGKPPPNVWTVMHKWILALPSEKPEHRTRQKLLLGELRMLIQDLSQRPGLGDNGVGQDIPFAGLSARVASTDMSRKLVFAHCDLLSGNVIIEPTTAGVTNSLETENVSVSFIDYEYAIPSPAAFDIANHFAEWGGFDCDYTVLPTRSQRREFIREYVRAYFQHKDDSMVDVEGEVSKLVDEVDVFRGVPGFYWGIWALIQALISEIDFDYASYAETRLGEYWAWKAGAEGSQKGDRWQVREKRWASE